MDHPTPDPDAELKKLDAAIKSLKGDESPKKQRSNSAESQALRMVSDFSAACLVGAALGYGADQWLGSSPWLLLFGLMLGFATGTKLLLDAEARAKRKAAKSESKEI